MGKLITQKQAKVLLINKLSKIAKDAAVARETCKKFYSESTVIQRDIARIADYAIELRNIVSNNFGE